MDTWVDIFMKLVGIMEGISLVRGILAKECFHSFAWKKNYFVKYVV